MDRMAIAAAIPFIAKEFGLSALSMGSVLSAFFVGYALMQIPGGMLADRFGPRRVMAASIAGWTIFTVLTGMANGLWLLLAIRVLFGISEGSYPPSASKAVALWFPRDAFGRASGFQLSAVQVGAAVAPIFVAWIIARWGWKAVFFALSVPGIVLTLLVWFCVQEAQSPVAAPVNQDAKPASTTKDALKLPVVRWCAVTIFLWSIAVWGLMSWLPTYLLQARGFSLAKMGLLAPLPYLAGAVGYFVGGYAMSDRRFNQRRRVPIAIGLIGGGVGTWLAAVAPTGELATAALVMSFLFAFIPAGGIFTMPLVTVPQQAVGAAFGFINAAAQAAAFLSPVAIGYVLSVTHNNFALMLYGCVGFFVVAAAVSLRILSPISAQTL